MNEYQDMFGSHKEENKASFARHDQEEHKQKLMYELNASGKYFAFKEQLKVELSLVVSWWGWGRREEWDLSPLS